MKLFILLIFTSLVGLSSCTFTVEQPVLSGILWGGEGNRLILRSVSDSDNPPDTILIDNKSEFVWNPEVFERGLYYLENMNDRKIILILDPDKPQFIDGQYATFPNQLITVGTNLPELFLKVEMLCEAWNEEIISIVKAPPSTQEEGQNNPIREKSEGTLDSLKSIYREKALSISDDPLVKMVVLMQFAGNNPLFDTWNDRALFLEVESELQPNIELNEVRIFSEKVAKLREMELHYNKVRVGDIFPLLVFRDDTISSEKYAGKPVYIEIRKSDTSYKSPDFSQYGNTDLKTFILVLDEKEEEVKTINHLGIMQFPSNFLLNTEGIVAGKNIWGKELKEAIELLLIKKL